MKSKVTDARNMAVIQKILAGIGIVVLALGLVFVLSPILAVPVMLIANYLFAPTFLLAVFGVAKLTFWRAFWLLFFTGIVFKSTTSNSK